MCWCSVMFLGEFVSHWCRLIAGEKLALSPSLHISSSLSSDVSLSERYPAGDGDDVGDIGRIYRWSFAQVSIPSWTEREGAVDRAKAGHVPKWTQGLNSDSSTNEHQWCFQSVSTAGISVPVFPNTVVSNTEQCPKLFFTYYYVCARFFPRPET